MSSLAKYYSSNLVGFFSYSREDDVDFDEVLSKFRNAIQVELSAQLAATVIISAFGKTDLPSRTAHFGRNK